MSVSSAYGRCLSAPLYQIRFSAEFDLPRYGVAMADPGSAGRRRCRPSCPALPAWMRLAPITSATEYGGRDISAFGT